jgi:hypothetical protein
MTSMSDTAPDLSAVTRFEVIDHTGRTPPVRGSEGPGVIVVAYGVSAELLLQDDGRTLKVFLRDRGTGDTHPDPAGILGRAGTVTSRLTEDDADGLGDLAERSRRAAKTARLTASFGAGPAADVLSQMASHLESAAALADDLVALAESGQA